MTDEPYIQFNTQSVKYSPLGFFNSADGTITINLDEIYEECKENKYCNREGILIETLIDVLIHEELHKRFDEAEDEHHVLNEQDEWAFKVIGDWIDNEKIYSSEY